MKVYTEVRMEETKRERLGSEEIKGERNGRHESV